MKTALVIGSTRGIGSQIGKDLLDKGYYVIFNYVNDDDSAMTLRTQLRGYQGLFQIIKADMSNINQITTLIKDIDTLDVIVLNAGATDRTPFGEITLSNWYNVFDTNLVIPFFLIQKLRERINKNGKIIFISSIAGCTTDSTSIAYGVSKGAIHVLVPYLAKEFADKKITVNAIAPGYIDTNWHLSKDNKQIERIEQKCLAKRLGTVKEVSKAVMSMVDNDFINGQIIRVDGGFGLC